MIINITVPEYPICIPLSLDASVPLQTYSWVDIVACNIVNNPDVEVKVTCVKCEGQDLDCTKSLLELGIQESACISVEISTQTFQELYNETKQQVVDE